jgi:predicted nucleic acid-binding protein
VTEAVLDASVVMKWFRADGERHLAAARSLRAAYEAGELVVFAPPLLQLEIVNVAGRRWGWAENSLVALAEALVELGFEAVEPDLARVAHWTARGLTAYDSAYVAVAESTGAPLVTDDELVLSVAGRLASALADADG